MALAEHVSISPGAGHRPVDLERRPAHELGTVQLRRRLGTRRISPKVPTAACSNVIIAQREARNVRISFQLSMTIKLDPPGSRQGVPVSDPLAGTPQPRGRHRCWGANSLFLDRLGCSNPDRHDTQAA